MRLVGLALKFGARRRQKLSLGSPIPLSTVSVLDSLAAALSVPSLGRIIRTVCGCLFQSHTPPSAFTPLAGMRRPKAHPQRSTISQALALSLLQLIM